MIEFVDKFVDFVGDGEVLVRAGGAHVREGAVQDLVEKLKTTRKVQKIF